MPNHVKRNCLCMDDHEVHWMGSTFEPRGVPFEGFSIGIRKHSTPACCYLHTMHHACFHRCTQGGKCRYPPQASKSVRCRNAQFFAKNSKKFGYFSLKFPNFWLFFAKISNFLAFFRQNPKIWPQQKIPKIFYTWTPQKSLIRIPKNSISTPKNRRSPLLSTP